jgi:ubiquinone/menaquinone biosynthesis C-methylase UbiE
LLYNNNNQDNSNNVAVRRRQMKEDNFKLNPEFYDLQVNWDKRLDKEKDFDMGCGTGHHAQFFSNYIRKIVAADPSEEMIDFAREKVVKSPGVTLIKAGFEDLDKIPYGPFDLITVLGNTLPILETRKNVKQALKKMKKKLAKNGIAIVQFLNFDSIVMEKNRFYTPKVVEKNGKIYIFIKHFEYGKIKTRVDFVITEIYKNKVEGFFINSSYLCTLKPGLFVKMARNAGFKRIELLGPDGEKAFSKKEDISLYALMSG